MNMLEWGLSHNKVERENSMSILVSLSIPGGPHWNNIKASPVSTRAEIIRDKVTVQSQNFRYVFDYAKLLELGIPLQRGLIMENDVGKFSLVLDRLNVYEFDDELQQGIILSFVALKPC